MTYPIFYHSLCVHMTKNHNGKNVDAIKPSTIFDYEISCRLYDCCYWRLLFAQNKNKWTDRIAMRTHSPMMYLSNFHFKSAHHLNKSDQNKHLGWCTFFVFCSFSSKYLDFDRKLSAKQLLFPFEMISWINQHHLM